jgi:5-formyltetrahydrofolate cyclo-ligase
LELDPKTEIRRQLLDKRRSLSIPTWQDQSQQICNHLAQSELIKNAEVILGFISFRQEPDLLALYQQFPQKTWGFPRCVGKNLEWYAIDPLNFEDSTQVGKFGILEPIITLPTIDLSRVDIILVPAIACDDRGYRLGYGGGFYDRFLSNQMSNQIRFTICVVFADFYLKTIPIQAWDIPTRAVCSENGIYLN